MDILHKSGSQSIRSNLDGVLLSKQSQSSNICYLTAQHLSALICVRTAMQHVCTGAWEILPHQLRTNLRTLNSENLTGAKVIKLLASKKVTQRFRRLRKDAEPADHYIYAVIKHCSSHIQYCHSTTLWNTLLSTSEISSEFQIQ